tara:strand:- start:172 stop:402 length:231 start_codon:yes stop_codon:yes gene_type:complete
MSEAEKKAEEIIEKFRVYGEIEVSCRPLSVKIVAKQCALIHVNGKLKPTFIKGKRYDVTLIEILFWQEVKTIIENK